MLVQDYLLLAYYGLFRIGELTQSQHQIKAKDIHIRMNKKKILVVLYSSKTHDKKSWPQKVKITANASADCTIRKKLFFCPFQTLHKYLALHGNYTSDDDPFFIFKGNIPVRATNVRQVLFRTLQNINLNHKLYNTQSFRIGRVSDMIKYGASVDQI